MLRFLLCLTASLAVVLSGYFVGYGNATADALATAKQLRAESRKPASVLSISQCGSTLMAIVARGDGSLILVTSPARDADKINGIAHSLPYGRAATVRLPCPSTSVAA